MALIYPLFDHNLRGNIINGRYLLNGLLSLVPGRSSIPRLSSKPAGREWQGWSYLTSGFIMQLASHDSVLSSAVGKGLIQFSQYATSATHTSAPTFFPAV